MEAVAAQPRVSRKDRLVRWDRAAEVLNVSEATLATWYDKGILPVVQTPGLMQTYQSFLDAVMNGARPRRAANVEEIARQWWADNLPQALEGAA